MKTQASHNQTLKVSWWRNSSYRNLFFQVLVLSMLAGILYLAVHNTTSALEKQNIASGFDFLQHESAFAISDTLINYSAESSFGHALLVGLLNTLLVIVLGNVLAIIWGTLIGIARLSNNWLLAKIALVYVNTLRNIPLLLQLFFWYAIITEILPSVRNAISIVPGIYLSQRGLAFPIPEPNPVFTFVGFSILFALGVCALLYRKLKEQQHLTGKQQSFLPLAIVTLVGIPLITWIIGGAPTMLNTPKLTGFNFQGGFTLTPEFGTLLLGLVLYTSAFIAEIVRSGIEAVDKGQREAALSTWPAFNASFKTRNSTASLTSNNSTTHKSNAKLNQKFFPSSGSWLSRFRQHCKYNNESNGPSH